jgi:Tfp pilus assembly protein PilF
MAPPPPQTTSPRRFPRRASEVRLATFARGVLTLAVIAALWPARDSYAQRSCEEWFADVTAVEGVVEVRRQGGRDWAALASGARVCSGDALRSEPSSRATITLIDGTTLRLDENSALALPDPAAGVGSLIELLRGVIHVISRDPRLLLFTTPYANAGLEGTEFDIRVDEAARLTEVIVLEGSVVVTTPGGKLSVASDQVAIAKDGEAPTAVPYAQPIERMRWASYFPPLFARALPTADQKPSVADAADADFYAKRAAMRLTTARVAAAEADIAAALSIAPRNAAALSVSALLALARANRDTARQLVSDALAAEPSSVVARLALSHVEQSSAQLAAAERALREAAEIEPDNEIVLMRLAEIALAAGDTKTAIANATRAQSLAPAQSAPHVVLGFANLRAFDTGAAERSFAAAIALEPDAPMAWLGAALASVQGGDLAAGRRQLEFAVVLDPANPLTRSYMAKIYDAENRGDLTASQLDLAKEFDPFDPTPWLYSSLHNLRTNRPVEALQDLRAASQRNGDRPAFRSWLAVDEDVATRSAGIGRVHNELGFGRLALNDAWRAIEDDPTNFAAHRLLADGYSTEPRHEIARVSELLISQLLQPANVAPIKPQLAQQNLFIAQRAGPSHTSFDELSAPVVTNGLKLRASAVAGGNGIQGDEVALAGLHDRLSYSFGHYRFETDGFRDNNDLEQSAANAFVQYRPSQDLNLQLELRSARLEHGDQTTHFNRDVYARLLRQDEDTDSLRLGAKYDLTPRHTLLGSMIVQDSSGNVRDPGASTVLTEQKARNVDVQEIFRADNMTVQSGIVAAQSDETLDLLFGPPDGNPLSVLSASDTNRQLGLYSYVTFNPIASLTVTAGASFDAFEIGPTQEDAVNPKIGLAWRPTPRTTVRAAAFETLYNDLTTSSLNAQPRLEPVQVAGFTQFLLGGRGDQATVRGVAVEHDLSPEVSIGWQADSRRTAALATTIDGAQNSLQLTLHERSQHAYLYWMPRAKLSFNAAYERGRSRSEPMAFLGYSRLQTARLPLEVRYFARGGLSTGLRASHVRQEGVFQVPAPASSPFDPPTLAPGQDRFWVLDAFVGYRLPNRRGLLSVNADNLLDETFQFQDIDPTNPSLFPERFVSLRFTLSFD